MREIIKVLLNEGLQREDVVAICKYIKEEYIMELYPANEKTKKAVLKARTKDVKKAGGALDKANDEVALTSIKRIKTNNKALKSGSTEDIEAYKNAETKYKEALHNFGIAANNKATANQKLKNTQHLIQATNNIQNK